MSGSKDACKALVSVECLHGGERSGYPGLPRPFLLFLGGERSDPRGAWKSS